LAEPVIQRTDPGDGIELIALPTPFRVGDVNTWLLRGEPLTLVDAGPRMESTEARLDAELAALGVSVEDLELIVLTHQHTDHVGLAGRLARRSGAAVAATADVARFLADAQRALQADDEYAQAMMRRHGVTNETIETLASIARAFHVYVGDVTVDHVLEPGGTLRAGGRHWRVHARPGHSPTDTVLAADGVLLAGDHLLPRISSNPIAHLPIGADPHATAASPGRPRPLLDYLDSLAATAGEDGGERILPGHGEPFTGAAQLIATRVAMTERRAEKILAALDHERTAADLGRDLWRHVPVTQAYLVLSEALGHLDLLERHGRVSQREEGGGVLYSAT
jgi:glyoxylase-like metal-dependent hydrolase (beta-lactamase superfamily II)